MEETQILKPVEEMRYWSQNTQEYQMEAKESCFGGLVSFDLKPQWRRP
jgi:hypothetical protein